MKIINAKPLQLLPPAPHLCQCCAVEHHPDEPHDPQSFYYQWWFSSRHNRSATWADAMAHCPEAVVAALMLGLTRCGVDINSTNLTGDVTSTEDLESRLS